MKITRNLYNLNNELVISVSFTDKAPSDINWDLIQFDYENRKFNEETQEWEIRNPLIWGEIEVELDNA